ncbi:hypothetical protein Tco_1405867 [Tanacetum coccineum]
MEELKGKINMGFMLDDWKDIIEKIDEYPCNNAIRSVSKRVIVATTGVESFSVKKSSQVCMVAREWNVVMKGSTV